MKKRFVLERGNVFMKKLLSFVLIIALMFSGCGAEKIGTDYDFSKVMEETMANIIENTPNPENSSIAGEWSVMVAARSGAEVPEGWYDIYYENSRWRVLGVWIVCQESITYSGVLLVMHHRHQRATLF